jgi:selenoprotein W-related protein
MAQRAKVEIEYCDPCFYVGEAVRLANELLQYHSSRIDALTIIPSDGGVFDVRVDGKKVYSMYDTGRYPTVEEIAGSLEPKPQ